MSSREGNKQQQETEKNRETMTGIDVIVFQSLPL